MRQLLKRLRCLLFGCKVIIYVTWDKRKFKVVVDEEKSGCRICGKPYVPPKEYSTYA